MIDLEPYRNHISNLCKFLRVKELELFGSATRDDSQLIATSMSSSRLKVGNSFLHDILISKRA